MVKPRRQLILGLPAVLLAIPAAADQPHMQTALDYLRSAERELEKASADKGGHRANAISFVKKAIAEVDRGISYDHHH
jgi:hypothetical protein